MTRQLRVAVLSNLFLLSSLSTVHSVRAQNAPPKRTKPPQPVMDQMTNIPYFTLRDGMSSTLTLNNLAASPTPVTVTIYNEQGKGQVLKPITLDPHAFKQIELRDVIVGDDFSSGNIEIMFNGISMAVTTQVSVSDPGKRISFESREADMMDFESASFAGIMSLPQAADGFLAVTNASKNQLTAQLTAGSLKKTIVLFPRETDLVKLNEDGEEHAPTATLVTLQHNGLPGDIITTGFVLNLKDGYSSAFTMVDPGMLRSGKLAGAHLRAGQPDPSEGFPEGTRFRSPLLLANISPKPVTAHVSVDYTVEDRGGSEGRGGDAQKDSSGAARHTFAKVKDLAIPPGAVQRVELSDFLGADHIAEAGVEIAHDGAPGAVIGQLTSVDQTGDYSFEVPIKDPSDPGAMVESAYPWTIESGTNTVLHLKNTTEDSVSALVVFVFPGGGGYSPDRIVLEPHQSIAIDIQKLKDSKKPDVVKQIFPADEGHGLLFWHQETPYSMIGRAEQTNVKTGIASSFSCNTGCCTNYGFIGFSLSPSSLTGVVGGSGSFQGYENYRNCQDVAYPNSTYPLGYPVSGSWTTSNSTVATVSSGNVSYVGGGTATVTGTFHEIEYYLDADVCRIDNVNSQYDPVDGQVTACVPASIRIIEDITDFPNNEHLYNYCNSLEVQAGSFTGIERCFLFQLVDSCGHDITTGGNNYQATEHRTAFRMSPSGQSVANINGPVSPNGTFTDFMYYVGHNGTGDFLKVNQVIHVVDQRTGHDYTVASYCQDYETSPLALNHTAGTCQ